jgi:hypothetical protein
MSAASNQFRIFPCTLLYGIKLDMSTEVKLYDHVLPQVISTYDESAADLSCWPGSWT